MTPHASQPVIASFIQRVRSSAVGQEHAAATKTTTVLRVVHDEMVALLGGTEPAAIAVGSGGVSSYLVVGVQGSGKTTTCAKLAVMLQRMHYKSVLLVSLDNRRPAGQEQLALLAAQWGVASLPILHGQQPLDIVARAKAAALQHGHDCVLYDTAGRLRVEEELMQEIAAVRDAIAPVTETLLVADAGLGNEATRIAAAFQARVPLTGIILTRLDGAARAGAALSMSEQTRVPIKLVGTGERVDDLKVNKTPRAKIVCRAGSLPSTINTSLSCVFAGLQSQKHSGQDTGVRTSCLRWHFFGNSMGQVWRTLQAY
jgi:signal recognition particle subunit SRP54